MASRKKFTKYSDLEKKELCNSRGKNTRKKSPPSFVKLDGLSQSEKDRRMNDRTVKPPKNLNLVEGDPIDNMEFERKSRQLNSFPNEHLLSSKIKEVNGMDYSNYSIEQYYRPCNSESDSQEISEDSTNSSSLTSDSIQSVSEIESCARNASSLTGLEESSNTENDSAANCSDTNHQEESNFNNNSDSIEADKMTKFKRRYYKNAAIIGLIENNMISLKTLELDGKEKEALHSSEDDFPDLGYSPNNNGEEMTRDKNRKDNSAGKFDSNINKIAEYPHLVPHPDDPEFFTHPLQAYGKVNDDGIDFRLPRIGEKTIITPRQYFIHAGLNDDIFTFQRNTTEAPKPKINFNIPKPSTSISQENEKFSNEEQSTAYDLLINDENDSFTLNHQDFPTLQLG